jgi:hypothetical protein
LLIRAKIDQLNAATMTLAENMMKRRFAAR